MSQAYIETFTGKQFDIIEATPQMVCIEDLAHSLSGMNRFTSHCRYPYPVSQHSRLGSYLVPEEHALRFLLHDGSEAYIGDMNRPLKHFTKAGEEYRKVEAPLQQLIYSCFGIYGPDPDIIHDVDAQMLYAEKAQLMGNTPFPVKWSKNELAADVKIVETSFYENKKLFLERFHELYHKEKQ